MSKGLFNSNRNKEIPTTCYKGYVHYFMHILALFWRLYSVLLKVFGHPNCYKNDPYHLKKIKKNTTKVNQLISNNPPSLLKGAA